MRSNTTEAMNDSPEALRPVLLEAEELLETVASLVSPLLMAMAVSATTPDRPRLASLEDYWVYIMIGN